MKVVHATNEQSRASEELQAENESLRDQLREAAETIDAIRSGAVDALVVEEQGGHRIYTLEGAERPYRLFVEEMEQGAATLHKDGTIAWCNRQLGRLLKIAPEELLGMLLRDFVSLESHTVFDNLLWQGQTRSGRGEAQLKRSDSARVPVFLTFNALPKDCGSAIGVLITDLTPQRHHEQLSAAHTALRESQQQLALVTDTVPIFIAHCDTESRYKFVNEQYARRFGLTAKDCVGKRLGEVVGEEAAQTLHKHVDNVLKGHAVEFEVEIPYTKLGRHFMHCSYVPERDTLGRIVGFVAAISDISERRQMEEALRESQAQSERQRRVYEAILTNTPDFAYVFDLQHRFAYLNEGLLKMFGRTREDAIGKTFLELGYEPWHAEMHCREIDQVVATRRPVRGEVPFNGTYGRRIYDYIFVPVFGVNGEVEVVAGTTRDVTERKQFEEEQARLGAIIESSEDAIISKTLDGIVTSWNTAAERLLGYQAAEMVGQPIIRVLPADRLNEETEILACLRREERMDHFETVRMTKDGRRIEVSLTISPIRDGAGHIIGASKIMRDITQRKRIEEQLRRNHETFFNLIENAPFGLYIVDSEFRLRQVSAASQRVFSGVSPLIGRDFAEVLRFIWEEPFASKVIGRFRRTLETGVPYEAPSTTEKRADIHAVESYDWKIERITLPDGHLGVVCYFYDVTQRKQAEEALQAMQAQLQEHADKLEARVAERTSELQSMNEQLEAFVYSIAHDLRAPLRSMQGFSEMLVEQAGPTLSDTGRDLAHRISRSAMFMDALLKDLLVFSQTAQQRIELTPVDLETVVRSVLSRQEGEIQEKGAHVELIGPWPKVLAHEATLEQVVFNLLSNALKFSHPAVAPIIKVRVQEWASVEPPSRKREPGQRSGSWVRVWVEDNGIGIAPEHRAQIFRLFVRLNGKGYPGTGVGLAIVHKGVERMGGHTGLESDVRRGSRFWFDLRRAEQG